MSSTPQADSSTVRFPNGPTYAHLTGSDVPIGWVRFKVWSADWFISTLEQLQGEDPAPDRLVGVEMAMDGALSALSGAFDAAIALLIPSLEELLETPKRTPSYTYGWGKARPLLLGPGFAAALAREGLGEWDAPARLRAEVDAALAGEKDPVPSGWLTVLRRLRNRTTHQDALSRTWDENATGDGLSIVALTDVPGGDPVAYLKESSDKVSDLTELALSVANGVQVIGANTPLLRQPWSGR